MQIKFEHFEQKQIMNFYPPQNIVPVGVALVQSSAEKSSSLPDRILSIDGVKRCLITSDAVSVCYEKSKLESVKALVLAEIDDFFNEKQNIDNVCDNPTAELAEAVADAFIRPTLNRDGGDIEIHSVSNSVLELSFTGHCAGCPYAQNTLQNVIMRTLQKYIPQINEVRLKGA